jgi:hypothetical protein
MIKKVILYSKATGADYEIVSFGAMNSDAQLLPYFRYFGVDLICAAIQKGKVIYLPSITKGSLTNFNVRDPFVFNNLLETNLELDLS